MDMKSLKQIGIESQKHLLISIICSKMVIVDNYIQVLYEVCIVT